MLMQSQTAMNGAAVDNVLRVEAWKSESRVYETENPSDKHQGELFSVTYLTYDNIDDSSASA
jgi:hypothetical protein